MDQPLKLFAASRRGEDIGLGSDNIAYPKLDISSGESIKSFASVVSQEGPIDVLINNAGVNLDNDYGPENAKRTLDVNYRGTLEVMQFLHSICSMYADRFIDVQAVYPALIAQRSNSQHLICRVNTVSIS